MCRGYPAPPPGLSGIPQPGWEETQNLPLQPPGGAVEKVPPGGPWSATMFLQYYTVWLWDTPTPVLVGL